MATRRKKLYFNINLVATGGIPIFAQAVACTQFRSTYGGDMYGSVLEDLAPLTGSDSNELKRRNEVTAWFQPITGQHIQGSGTSTTYRNQRVYVRFTEPTVSGNAQSVTILSSFAGYPAGMTPIGTRHFGVLVSRDWNAANHLDTGVSPTVRGRLFVQRQHNIEI